MPPKAPDATEKNLSEEDVDQANEFWPPPTSGGEVAAAGVAVAQPVQGGGLDMALADDKAPVVAATGAASAADAEVAAEAAATAAAAAKAVASKGGKRASATKGGATATRAKGDKTTAGRAAGAMETARTGHPGIRSQAWGALAGAAAPADGGGARGRP